MSSIADRVIKNTGWLYAKMAITMFVSLYTTRLILNGLGVVDFGIYNIVGGAIGMLGFLNASMAAATQRFLNYSEGQGNHERKKIIFNTSVTIHLILGVLVAIILFGAGFVFFNGVLNIPEERMAAARVVYGCLIVSTFLTVINVPYDAIINSHENMRYYAFVGILESLLRLSVAFICVKASGDKLIWYGILMMMIPMITLTIMKVYCHRHYEECSISLVKYHDRGVLKEMLGFAGWNFLGAMSGSVGNYGSGIVLNHFYGTALNAATGIAHQVNSMLSQFSTNMLKAVNPVITKSEGAGNREGMIRISTTSCKYSFAIIAVFAVPLIVEMPYIQKLWLKNVPEWAVLFAQLHLVRTLIEQITISYSSAISAEGRIANYNKIVSLLYLVPVALLYILFSLGFSPFMMYVINITIFGVAISCTRVVFAHKNCQLKYKDFFTDLLIPVSLSFLLSLGITYLPTLFVNNGFVRLFIVVGVGVTSFMAFFWLFAMTTKEKEQIIGILRQLIGRIWKRRHTD